MKGLRWHLGLLALGALLAARVALSSDEGLKANETVVWSDDAASIQRVTYQSNKELTVLEAREDEAGRYFIATVKNGESGVSPGDTTPDSGENQFISVTQGEAVAAAFAPLVATRTIGTLDSEGLTDFGFGEGVSSLVRIQFPEMERSLEIGGTTPGGAHVYARDPRDQQVYVLEAGPIEPLQLGTALLQGKLHSFPEEEVRQVKIARGTSARLFSRAPDATFWTSPESEGKDETASNWISKLAELTVGEYVRDLASPEGVLRVDYQGAGGALGFLELARREKSGDRAPELLVRSELTRWWAVAEGPGGADIADDVATLLPVGRLEKESATSVKP